jgi:enoyl-CoA hydratase/carnithine racemase
MRALEFVGVERDGPLTIITINRPQAMNALTREMHQELADVFDDFAADPAQWIGILTGAGERAFCAGSDLKQIASGEMPRSMNWSGGYAGLVSRLELNKPLIAAVNGVAMGGGFELALACDLIIAADRAQFGLPEPRVGVAAVGGGLHRLPRQIGLKRAMDLILTGRKVSAAEGYAMGFVNEVVPAAELMAAAKRWAAEILRCSPMAIRASKDGVQRGADEATLADALAHQLDYPGLRAMWESEDYREGPAAFAAKRVPVWKGS